MKIIQQLTNTFLNFNEKDYIKLFVSIKGKDSPVVLSFINRNHVDIIKNHFKDFFIIKNENLYLTENYNTPHLISEAFTFFAMQLEQKEGIKMRYEQMLLQSDDAKYSLGYIDRSIIHIFGIKASGIHLNAYVDKLENGKTKRYMWIAKRSASKLHDPNKYDNLVAGAMSLGFSNFETLKKEAQEEAGIKENLSKNANLDKIITYKSLQYGGLRNDVVNIYSLKLPENFTPIAVDGEVEDFFLIPVDKVLSMLLNDYSLFKYNSALVMLYFLHSNGYVKNLELSEFLNTFFNNLYLK